jgi:hypothetical protein
MECYRHGGTESTATCVGCQRPICAECTEEVAGHPMCQPCVADAEARLSPQPAPWLAQAAPPPGELTPALAPSGEVMLPGSTVATAATEVLADASAPAAMGTAPGILRRLGRGWFWGICYGQWWTLMTVASSLLWGHGLPGIGDILVMAFWYGFFGSLAGIVIGAANAFPARGAAIGVGAGIVVCLIEAALSHSAGELVNLVFYFFTGRFVGAGIAWRVQQPVR